MIIFDGYQFAQEKEQQLAPRVQELKKQGKHPSIAAILFREDAGSQLYTRLKRETAERIGIGYQVFDFSLTDPVEHVITKIEELNADPQVTGIIIQKPWKRTFQTYHPSFLSTKALAEVEEGSLSADKVETPSETKWSPRGGEQTYADWWSTLTGSLNETKDVDGLHPNTIEAIKRGTWKQEHRVLPATCSAVLKILEKALLNNSQPITNNPKPRTQNLTPNNSQPTTHNSQIVSIIGKSDLLGTPLFYELKNQGWLNIELLGKKELQQKIDSGEKLKKSKIIISATGQKNLITDQLIADDCIIIDAGEPKGDVDFDSVKDKVKFITPVPGGVGPVTILSLLENCLELSKTSLPLG